MNKHNKLARNAIRARKAKNKRVNEQDKPKKGKLWFIRLGSLMGCLLLVSALVVPCFADEISTTADVTVSYGFALDQFADMLDDRAYNDAYGMLLSYYNGFGDSRLFQCDTLVSGVTEIANNSPYSVIVPLDIFTANDNQSSATLSSQIELECFAFSIFTDFGDSPDYSHYFGDGYISVVLYYEDNNSMVDLAFYDNSEQIPQFFVRYNGISTDDGLNYQLANVSADGITYMPDQLAKVESAFTLLDGTTPSLLSLVTSLLYDPLITSYNEAVYSPSNFYYGLDSAYDLGYADAERYAYAAGYNDGYDDAINMNASANLGKNLLGETFTAPLKALEEFNLVSWRTANGTLVEISIMSILSAIVAVGLFFLFIKMFAGG